MSKKEVTNLGEALSVFVQIAGLAQKNGVLSFDDSVIAKSAIDFVEELAKQANENQQPNYETEAPQFEAVPSQVENTTEAAKPRRSRTSTK